VLETFSADRFAVRNSFLRFAARRSVFTNSAKDLHMVGTFQENDARCASYHLLYCVAVFSVCCRVATAVQRQEFLPIACSIAVTCFSMCQ
jgi:hypothetical protein